MKKFTSLLALFLISLGMIASAQTTVIQSVEANLKDLSTLKTGDYVLLQCQQSKSGYLFEENGKLGFNNITIEAGSIDKTKYLWKVTQESNGYSLCSFSGKFLPVLEVGVPAKVVLEAQKETFEIGNVDQKIANKNWYLKSINATSKNNGSVYCRYDKKTLVGGEHIGIPTGNNGQMNFKIFKVTFATASDFDIAKNTWQKIQNLVGFYSKADVSEACKKTTLAEAQQYLNSCQKIEINPDEYYRLVSVKRGVVMSVNADGMQFTEKEDLSSVDQLWRLEKNGTGYNLVNANYAKYLAKPVKSTGNNWNVSLAEQSNSLVLTIADLEEAQHTLMFENPEAPYVGAGGSSSNYIVTVKSANKNGDACWYIKPVTDLEVNLHPIKDGKGHVLESWGSLYLPFKANCGNSQAGIEYYGVSVADENNGTAQLKPTDGVQAGKGIILHCKNKKGQTRFGFKIGINANKVNDAQSWNILSGTNVSKPIEANAYVFGLNGNVPGLYGTAATTLKANKAYYAPATAAVNGFKFIFDEEVTGVDGVETATDSADGIYYDLSGRRVENPSHGIYIKSGKKVYVK